MMGRREPDIYRDEQRFLCEYTHAGGEWGLEIIATSAADASARLRAIGTTGQVRGVIHLKLTTRHFISRVFAIVLGSALACVVLWTASRWGMF